MSPLVSMTSLPNRIVIGAAVIVLAFSALVPVKADVRILSSPGGAIDVYLAAFARVRQSGEPVIIDGPCLSACTLVLSTIPHNRICVTRRAVLGFHAARWFEPTSGHTWRAPAGHTRRYRLLSRRGARLDQEAGRSFTEDNYLRGKELAALYRRC
jgi:hypothetical protein